MPEFKVGDRVKPEFKVGDRVKCIAAHDGNQHIV